MMNDNKQPESDVGKMLNTALSGITGMMQDVKAQINSKIESYVGKMDLVKREEFNVLKEMLTEIRKEQKSLKKELDSLKKAK